jgi:hypothetical protein
MRWVGHVECMGDDKHYKTSDGKPEGRRILGRPRDTGQANTKRNLKEIG